MSFAIVIEDDPELSVIFSKAMETSGYETESIRDGLLAQSRLKEVVPDVVILDLHLPHVQGEDLLNQIRADDRLSKTQVVVATADSRLASQMRAEADLVLLKPISFRELREIVNQIQLRTS